MDCTVVYTVEYLIFWLGKGICQKCHFKVLSPKAKIFDLRKEACRFLILSLNQAEQACFYQNC